MLNFFGQNLKLEVLISKVAFRPHSPHWPHFPLPHYNSQGGGGRPNSIYFDKKKYFDNILLENIYTKRNAFNSGVSRKLLK